MRENQALARHAMLANPRGCPALNPRSERLSGRNRRETSPKRANSPSLQLMALVPRRDVEVLNSVPTAADAAAAPLGLLC